MSTIGSDLSGIGIGAPSQQLTGTGSQDTFMTLMLTQLQNQDPLKPLESGEFLSQLAAFETAAGVTELQSSLAQLNASMYENQALQAASLLGHDVLTEASTVTLGTEGSVEGFVRLPSSASPVRVEVHDASGELVRTIDLGSQPAGRTAFTWDGLDATGARLPPGEYTLSCDISVDGTTQAVSVLMAAEVESVMLDGYDILLNLADGSQIPFSQVTEIL
jgi:flagellar basal-body rod modification protein FlgD